MLYSKWQADAQTHSRQGRREIFASIMEAKIQPGIWHMGKLAFPYAYPRLGPGEAGLRAAPP